MPVEAPAWPEFADDVASAPSSAKAKSGVAPDGGVTPIERQSMQSIQPHCGWDAAR